MIKTIAMMVLGLAMARCSSISKSSDADGSWMRHARFGVFVHYLAGSFETTDHIGKRFKKFSFTLLEIDQHLGRGHLIHDFYETFTKCVNA